MSELTREEIRNYGSRALRGITSEPEISELVRMALRTHDAEARAERYMSLLAELKSEYFDQRADADCEGDPLRYVPNEEMVWQARIDEVLNGSKSCR